MIVILFPIMLAYVLKREKLKLDKSWVLLLVISLYLLFFIYYVQYINHFFNLGPGLTQADAYWHYRGAEEISKGSTWVSLASLNARFERVGINTIGYFLYIEFLSVCCFKPALFSTDFNIYLFYFFQMLISIDSAIRFSNAISKITSFKRKSVLFLILSLCTPFMTQSYQLMRDVYYMWFAAIAFEIVCNNDKISQLEIRKKMLFWVSLIMAIVLRYYIIILIVPIILYYSNDKRVGKTLNYVIFVVLTIGIPIIVVIKDKLGIGWNFGNININEFLNFLMFPNFFNQARILMNFNYYFPTIDVSGSNVPGVYYLMSLWNLFVIPLALIGLSSEFKIKLSKNGVSEIIFWFVLLINNVLIYCVAYDSIDNRLKMFMTIPMMFFVSKGLSVLLKINKHSLKIYSVLICFGAIFTTLLYI